MFRVSISIFNLILLISMEVDHAKSPLHYVDEEDGLDWPDFPSTSDHCEFDEEKDLDNLAIDSKAHVPINLCSGRPLPVDDPRC